MKYHSALRVNACLLAMLVISGSVSAATQINALFMTQAAYSENDIRAMTSDFEKQHPDVKVNLEFVPYEALHDKIVAARGAGGNGYDVVLFDAIWPAEFSRFDLLQDVSSRIAADEREKIFPGAMNTVVYQGKTLGMPWILDTKYLYYNKAMLDKAGIKTPPASWQQVMDDAKVLKDKGIVKYPLVWSWSQAEALVCDYTTLVSGFGGSFYQNGKLDFSTPASLKAVTLMKTSLDQGLSNPASREYLEEDVRKAFSNGDAAFALNWTYMYNMANDPKQSKVAGDVGIVPAPGDTPDKPGAVNGSMGLGIAKSQSASGRGLAVYSLSDLPAGTGQVCQTELAGVESLVPGSCRCQRPGEPDRRRRQVVERDALSPRNGRLLAPVKHPATAASVGTAG